MVRNWTHIGVMNTINQSINQSYISALLNTSNPSPRRLLLLFSELCSIYIAVRYALPPALPNKYPIYFVIHYPIFQNNIAVDFLLGGYMYIGLCRYASRVGSE